MNEIVTNAIVDFLPLTETIHNDLQVIACFLVFFTLVILLYFGYKFFDMMWKF